MTTVEPGEQGEPTGPQRQRIMRFVRQFTEQEGYPPTLREIGAAVSLAPSSVHYHMSVLQGGGHMTRGVGRPRTAVARRLPVARPIEDNDVQVPLVGRIAAGIPVLAEETVEDTFWLPRKLVGEGTLFMLKVTGDSMTGAGINDGDLVVVRKQQSAINGEIVAAAVPSSSGSEAEGTIKTLQCVNGQVWLIPQNPAYAPIPADEVTIFGKVVAVLRSQL